jgi:hypothetical protein
VAAPGEVLLEVRQRLGRPGLELCVVTGLGIRLEERYRILVTAV